MADHEQYPPAAVTRRRALGVAGEDAACAWYEAAGFRVAARNWRCRAGELDVIATRGRLVVFCEVKTRSSDAYGVPASAVTPAKQRRIRHLAMRWLDEQTGGFADLRFDVAAVVDGRVEVIAGAF